MRTTVEAEALAYNIDDATRVAGISRAALYRAIQRGELVVRKSGRSTLILRRELERFLNALPQGVGPDPIRRAPDAESAAN